MLQKAMEYAVEMRSPNFIFMAQSFQAELAVLQGRAHEMIPWAEQAYETLSIMPMVSFNVLSLTIPKVLLSAGTADGRAKAVEALQRIHEYAVSLHHTRVLIEVLAIEAMLHATNNNPEAAHDQCLPETCHP
jgi:hypothetical protein